MVLEIEDAGDDRDKAFLMGAMLIRLTEHLRLRAPRRRPGCRRGLRHLTVIEEAHRLLRQPPPGTGAGPAAQATEMFADLLAEIRAYGEGLVIAEQIPAKLIPDVIKNTAVKIVHRLPARDDRDTVGATMNLTAGPVRLPGHPAPRRGRRLHRRHGPPAAGPDARRHRAAKPAPAAAASPGAGHRRGAAPPAARTAGAAVHAAARCAPRSAPPSPTRGSRCGPSCPWSRT